MNNHNEYTKKLEHRLAMISDDISKLIDIIDDRRLFEAIGDDAQNHIVNIENASDLNWNQESMEKYYQSPFSGEQWTKEQLEEYVQFEEGRIAEDKKNDCEDCYGCEKCESI